ncbi:alpha/beta fold hydrolase [Desulfosarcina ovata]|uniref:Alpha/beta hydrolase n=1 Tax=Desulfosarcina ovata subsp. ovata TaxID=2752305 RepID=A0A5K8AF57_9BACT|nr:alpha/beta hydrolase [Desulfosarcina ovata]BBO91275.1 alpha/beta hydrolase [Desulfosarcina ovata subsp. ovata]
MAYFRTQDGCSLYYETIGFELTRPVVVFLNGTLQTTMYWKVIAASLKPRFRSLLYDARGQGESELGDLPLTLDLHMDDLWALMRHLVLGPVCLVGLSHGALLGYAMARRKPKAISRLVLCSIGIRAPMRARLIVRAWSTILQAGGIEALVSAALPHVFGEAFLMNNRKTIDRIAKTIVRRNREASLSAHLSAMGTYPRLRSMLQPLEMPTLVMSGADDPLVSASGAAAVAEKSGGRHLLVKGAGHSIAAEAPELFLDTISRFLSDRWTDMPEGI